MKNPKRKSFNVQLSAIIDFRLKEKMHFGVLRLIRSYSFLLSHQHCLNGQWDGKWENGNEKVHGRKAIFSLNTINWVKNARQL